ncbi:SCF ubiquitin ligase complex subunit cdc4 [Tulasnella sp. 418]|nr:SCF ubiquitin ligase complex subunit cdc4 [Tulasnella sp. 418]
MASQQQPQLVLGPATHTTVVTTTTVTTTTYAPIPLSPLPPPPEPTDPKQYPLLKAPLPPHLRQFPIEFPDGVKAIFSDGTSMLENAPTQWNDELPAGRGWAILKQVDAGADKSNLVGLQEAVERFNYLRTKRPLSGHESAQSPAVESIRNPSIESLSAVPYASPPPRKKARAHPVDSRAANGPPSPLPSPHGSPSSPAKWAPPSSPSQTPPAPTPPFQPDISLTTLLSLPGLVSHFSALPPQLQSHVLLNLLRHSPLPVLRTLHSVLTPTLARDFLTLLPPELTSIILSYLPAKALFSASRVSRSWRALIDSDHWVWREQLRRSSTWYGGPSETAFAERIWALRAKRYDQPHLYPNLSLPHPYKLLFKSRNSTYQRWQHNVPRRLTFPAHGTSVVTCLLFSRRRIISASDDHSIHMYSPFTGELVRTFPGHEGGVWALAVCSRRRKPPPSPILTPAHSPTSAVPPSKAYYHDMLVSGSTDRTVRIWDIETGKNTHVFGGHTSTVRCLAIARPVWVDAEDGSDKKEKWPKKTMIVTGSRDHTLRVWRLPAPGDPEYHCFGAQTQQGDPADEDVNDNPYHVMALTGHDNAVRALAVHGRTVVSGSYDTTVRVWDLITGDCKFVLTGHSQKVYSVVIDHMRNQTCSGSMDGTVRIWSLKNGSLLHLLSGHTSLVGLLSLSPTTLVSAAADSTLRIWDPSTGALQHVLSGHTGAITCFQHDEFKVLSGSDGTLKMWDTRDGSVTRDLLTGITGVWQVVFDRRFCVAASNRQDHTYLEVWDFAGDDEVGASGDNPGDLDDDLNSETGDPYDESRLGEQDVEDSESEDEDDADQTMDSGSSVAMDDGDDETVPSPSPSPAPIIRSPVAPTPRRRLEVLTNRSAGGPSAPSTSRAGINLPHSAGGAGPSSSSQAGPNSGGGAVAHESASGTGYTRRFGRNNGSTSGSGR